MNITKLNGITIQSDSSRSVVIKNGKVIIDGIDVTPDSKTINIVIQGNVDRLEVDSCEAIAVTGSVKTLSSISGDVNCGDISGNVNSISGDIRCGDIGGNVSTISGDVK
jgi:hypothetical protein